MLGRTGHPQILIVCQDKAFCIYAIAILNGFSKSSLRKSLANLYLCSEAKCRQHGCPLVNCSRKYKQLTVPVLVVILCSKALMNVRYPRGSPSSLPCDGDRAVGRPNTKAVFFVCLKSDFPLVLCLLCYLQGVKWQWHRFWSVWFPSQFFFSKINIAFDVLFIYPSKRV